MGSNVLTLVAIFLPLSSIWASSTVDSHQQQQSPSTPSFRRKLFGSYTSRSSGPFADRKAFGGPLSPTSDTATTRVSNSSLPSPVKSDPQHVYSDLEAQGQLGVMRRP